jgi:ketosteroid isomerase-like protein
MNWLRLASLILLALLPSSVLAQDHQAAVDDLLVADRAFAAAAQNAADPMAGLASMLDADAWMAVGGQPQLGREAIIGALRTSPSFREGRMHWAPIRGGVSADGMQGFTFGYLSLDAGDPARRERKYLSYWVRRAEGWRVVAYRQGPGAPGAAGAAMLPASLPGPLVPGDEAAHRNSLAAAEQAFSDQAQRVGLRAAFREYGRDDAINMGGPGPFVIGAEAISQAVGPADATSPVRWSTERSIVAASGDLGVSIGTIHVNGAVPEGQPASFPFFTVWRRDGADAPWRYVAE